MLQSPSQFASDLSQIVQAQWDGVTDLLQILDAERTALGDGDLEAIESTASDKIARLGELEQLKRQESRLLTELPFGRSDRPLEQALNWCDDDGRIRSRSDEVAALMQECEQRNRRNGLMVQHRINYVRRAIDVLHKAQADTLVYEADGSASSTRSSRLLAEG